jgi:hypothetical protein
MILWLATIDFLLLVICVGLADWILFYKMSSCPRCGEKPPWYSFIPATLLELTLFALGLALGGGWI